MKVLLFLCVSLLRLCDLRKIFLKEQVLKEFLKRDLLFIVPEDCFALF